MVCPHKRTKMHYMPPQLAHYDAKMYIKKALSGEVSDI